MTNEQELIRSVFNSYIADVKAYSTKQNYGTTVKELEAVRDKSIQALETQLTVVDETYLSIEDAIGELEAQREHIVGYMSVVGTTAYDMGIEALKVQPKKGKWIVISCEPTDIFKCSGCGMRVINPYHYCPNCGAEMG